MLRTRHSGTHSTSSRTTRRPMPFSVKVHASFDEVLAPILVGAGALAGAFVGSRLTSNVNGSCEYRQSKPPHQPQQQPQQRQKQQHTWGMKSKSFLALVRKRQNQVDQLMQDKQKLQQAAKKSTNVLERLQSRPDKTEQELSAVRSQHAAAAMELLQVREELDQSNKQLQLLKQREAQLAAASTSPGSTCNEADTSAAAAAAGPLRVAFVGGKELKRSHKAVLPSNCEVRHFGSSRDMGEGEVKRLEACIKAGTIDEVYMLTRWNGHGITKRVQQLCRPLRIPVRFLSSPELTILKSKASATLDSDMSCGKASRCGSNN